MQEHNEKKGRPIQRIPSLVGVFAFILFPFVSIWCCAKHGHTNILTCQRLLSRVSGTCEVVAAGRENAHRPAGRSVRQETSTLAAAVKAGQVLFFLCSETTGSIKFDADMCSVPGVLLEEVSSACVA
jgi:hypothetical protein